jgi:hypothetical protein
MYLMKKHLVFTLSTALLLLSSVGDASAQEGQPTRLANVSTRMKVLTGNEVMIAGFVVGGATSKTIAVIATGPSLSQYGIENPLANPTLTLVRSSDQAVIATNDDWQSAPNAAAIQSSGFAPSSPLEPAILAVLPPGAYTAIVSGKSGGTGVAVAAAYEVAEPAVPLLNISTRGSVLTGGDVMIVSGNSSKQVAIVGTGPSLAQHGIVSPLANPTLTLVRSSDQVVLATNDNWSDGANADILRTIGLAPPSPLEPALLVTLPPGPYTAILSGAGNSTGIGVLGVYEVPPQSEWPPRVLTSSPAHTETQVAVTRPVVVNFSKPMDAASLNSATFTLQGPFGPVPGTVSAASATQAVFTPAERLLTEAQYTGTVTVGARDSSGRAMTLPQVFGFSTRDTEPPPIVAGCPAPEANSEVRRLDHPAPPKVLKRTSAHVTSVRIPRPGSIRFLQGQMPVTPASPYTEMTISRCPGVIEPNLHSQCRLASSFYQFNSIAAVDRPLSDNQDTAAGCLAPSSEQYYVNFRWTFATCHWGLGECGFSIQWAN